MRKNYHLIVTAVAQQLSAGNSVAMHEPDSTVGTKLHATRPAVMYYPVGALLERASDCFGS